MSIASTICFGKWAPKIANFAGEPACAFGAIRTGPVAFDVTRTADAGAIGETSPAVAWVCGTAWALCVAAGTSIALETSAGTGVRVAIVADAMRGARRAVRPPSRAVDGARR